MMRAQVFAIENASRANGPGARFVVWLQGCTLGCPGCYNPGTHASSGGESRTVAELIDQLVAAPGEGMTLTGGEPMQQATVTLELLTAARANGKSTLMFSGYTLAEIAAHELGPQILGHLDVLIDGRYDQAQHVGRGLLGSANQLIHCLTARYRHEEVARTPELEVRIDRSGDAIISGVDPLKLRRVLKKQ